MPRFVISAWSRTALVAACAVVLACVGRTPISLGSDVVVGPDTEPGDTDPGDVDPGNTCTQTSCADRVFVSDAGTPRIQQFDALTGAFVASFSGTGEDVLAQPRGMVARADGSFWVVDAYGDKNFKHYQPDGTLLGETGPGNGGTADGAFDNEWNMAVDSSGHLWVTDNANNRVQVLDTDGTWLMTVGGGAGEACAGTRASATTCSNLAGHTACCAPNAATCTCTSGNAEGQFNFIDTGGIAIDDSDRVFVGDYNNHRVQIFDASGAYVSAIGAGYNGVPGAIGTAGGLDGQLNSPGCLTLDAAGNIWVVSDADGRVQEFNGTTLAWMQTPINAGNGNNADGALYQPEAIAFDSLGNIWLVDSLNSRVQKFSPTGSWLMTIGGGNGCAGTSATADACAPLPGLTSCCSPTAATCTCAQSAANGSFGAPWGLVILPPTAGN